MKDKWKSLSIALIIAVIVTGILAIASYYGILKPLTADENMSKLAVTSQTRGGSEDSFYQYTLFSIIGFLTVVFCVTTVLSYIVIERLRKRKKVS